MDSPYFVLCQLAERWPIEAEALEVTGDFLESWSAVVEEIPLPRYREMALEGLELLQEALDALRHAADEIHVARALELAEQGQELLSEAQRLAEEACG